MTHPTNTLRTELKVASRAAYLDGATEKQIEMIVALAQGSNDYNVLAGGRLTKPEASRIIDDMIEHGAKPDWTQHTEEKADHTAVREAKKVRSAERKARKEANQNDRNERALSEAGENGRRVRHPKLGDGTVIAEDDKAVTILFDNSKKPARIAADFLSNA